MLTIIHARTKSGISVFSVNYASYGENICTGEFTSLLSAEKALKKEEIRKRDYSLFQGTEKIFKGTKNECAFIRRGIAASQYRSYRTAPPQNLAPMIKAMLLTIVDCTNKKDKS